MIPRKGIVLLTRKSPPCPACVSLKSKLDKLVTQKFLTGYTELDVYDKKIPVKSVPMLIKNGTTILNGDSSKYTLSYLKEKLEV